MRHLLNASAPCPFKSLERLREVADLDCGASRAAASVVCFAWNGAPIRDLYRLDDDNQAAALSVIASALGGAYDGGKTVEETVSLAWLRRATKDYELGQ